MAKPPDASQSSLVSGAGQGTQDNSSVLVSSVKQRGCAPPPQFVSFGSHTLLLGWQSPPSCWQDVQFIIPGTDPSNGTHSSCISARGSPVCNNIKQLPTQSVVVLFDSHPGGKEQPWQGSPLLLLPAFASELLLLLLLLLTPLLALLSLLVDEELLFEEEEVMQLG